VERAKGELQRSQGLDEAQAFGWLRREAMNRRCSLAVMAKSVLEGTIS
jgi:AmiR/NasT family two-component response regulator